MDAVAALTASLPSSIVGEGTNLDGLRAELAPVIEEASDARAQGIGFDAAVQDDARWPALSEFHRGLKDALFYELPQDLLQWVESIRAGRDLASAGDWMGTLVERAKARSLATREEAQEVDRDTAAAEFLLFETVRLRLLLLAWSSEDYESLGGDEATIDAIAWHEVDAVLSQASARAEVEDVRLEQVMMASASVMLNADAMERALELEHGTSDTVGELRMQARLRAALRELRLPESRLLENALSNLLGSTRHELPELQRRHPLALGELTRQAMDQRVSRSRKALTRDPAKWPARKAPALFDLFRESVDAPG